MEKCSVTGCSKESVEEKTAICSQKEVTQLTISALEMQIFVIVNIMSDRYLTELDQGLPSLTPKSEPGDDLNRK